tara:strand:+ start:3093 stop:3518 length:426 start_codon:yes stop_codon:yes gene_type:complete
MIEAKVFRHKVNELDQRFSFIMKHYINYYIENGLSYDNKNEYYQPYMRLITNLEKLNSELFKINNQLSKNINILNTHIHNSKQNIKQQKDKSNKYHSYTVDSNSALEKMQQDTLLNYTRTNIILFNYLLGSILGIYILRNL